MAEITAAMVKELRERTNIGMMECKRALVESGGDMDGAEQLLRVRSGAKASRAAERIAAEGIVGSFIDAGGRVGALVEVNCETDFVSKNEAFASFAALLARLVACSDPADLETLARLPMPGAESVEKARHALVMQLGEHISVRHFARLASQGLVAGYVHGGRIGVLVDLHGGDAALGKDVAMHIAASKPVCVSAADVPPDLLAKEREIFAAQAAESGKPASIIGKMVEGRVAKYLAEITLLGQPFVKDPDRTVGDLLTSRGAEVKAFQLFLVGQGIEKKTDNFVADVLAQAGKVP